MTSLPYALQVQNHRLIVTTDIGGTDPDDEESMVHLLAMANDVDIEEASTVRCALRGESSARCTVSVPRQVSKGVIHLIAECCDAGSPALTSYRRIVIEVK